MRRATILLIIVLAACQPAADEDYLDLELRARVGRLVEEVAAEPTTAQTVVRRGEVLWEWTNAFALAGGVVPVNLTTAAAGVARARSADVPFTEDNLRALDGFVHELAVKDADPNAIGALVAAPSAPLAAGSLVTIEQTYTVGTLPITEGGRVLLGRQLQPDQGAYQHSDPAGENYVSIRSSNPAARWVPTEVPLAGMHGGFRGAEPMPAFRLEGTGLEEGETLTVIYGDTSGGSPGFRLQTFSTDQLFLPLYLDLEGEGTFFTPRWPAIAVEGGEVEAVTAIASSVVATGEPFSLRVRSEDLYWNRATGPKPAYRVLLGGEEVATIPAGGEALATVADLRLDRPGVYRYEVRSEDGSIAATSNPIWVEEAPNRRILWGETHGHTGMAEGQGSAGRFWTWARDDARLDFAGLSEHDIWLDDSEWREMQRLARDSAADGEFAAFLGYEWTSPRELGGHHNVFFRTPDRDRVGVQVAPTLPELYRGLHARVAPEDVLIIPHAHQAGDWTQSDGELERLVEIYSMHGTFEWFGNLYLRNGYEIGFIAASDDHRARPGYAHGGHRNTLQQRGGLAAVLAREETPDAIFASLRALSAYATSGPRILLDATLNGRSMGTRLPDADERQLLARASGTAPIDHIDVVKNGEVVYSRHYLGVRLRPRSWIQIGFESSSEVFEGRDNPRPYRVWEGTIAVEGARIVGLEACGLDNRYRESAAIDAGDPALLRFHVETRGRRDVLLLELEGASPATALRFAVEPSREQGFSPVLVRRPAELPGEDIRIGLGSLVDGRLDHELQVDSHTDRIRVQVVDLGAPLDQELEFTDMEPPEPGDYYYVRVTQVDGGQVWSSPFWVGER